MKLKDGASSSVGLSENENTENSHLPLPSHIDRVEVSVDPRLDNIVILKEGTVSSRKKRVLLRSSRLLTTLRGGERLILYGRGSQKVLENSLSTNGFPSTSEFRVSYNFLINSYVNICATTNSCFDVKGNVSSDGASLSINFPAYSDLCKIDVAGDDRYCRKDGMYLNLQMIVPLPTTLNENTTFRCRGDIESSTSKLTRRCVASCGTSDFSGCPSTSAGGALYLLRDTCAMYHQEDYKICLNTTTAMKCGYHIREKNSSKDSNIECERCPKEALCPGGPRIWPRIGYWVYTELAPMKDSGVSASPLRCPAPAGKRCIGWDVERRNTQCGPGFKPNTYKCSECDVGHFSTMWNRMCISCADDSNSDGSDSGLQRNLDEVFGVLAIFFSILLLLMLGICLVPTYFGAARQKSMYRGRRIFFFALTSIQVLVQISEQSTGYESPLVLKVYAYLSMMTVFEVDGVLPLECSGDVVAHNIFWRQNLIMSCLLILLCVWAWLCFAPEEYLFAPKPNGSTLPFQLQKYLLITLFQLYPLACRTALASTVCEQIHSSTLSTQILKNESLEDKTLMTRVLQSKPSIQCFGNEHIVNGSIGYMTILLYGVGFPFLLYWLLNFSKQFDQKVVARHHKDIRNKRRIAKTIRKTTSKSKITIWRSKSRKCNVISSSTVNPIYKSDVHVESKSANKSESNLPMFPVRSSTAVVLKNQGFVNKPARNSVHAFVRFSSMKYLAFKPLVDSDYALHGLLFRPAYLYVLLLLSVGCHLIPPGTYFAIYRLIFSVVLLFAYYGGLLVLRPLKYNRQWILPIHLSIFVASLLSLILIIIIEVESKERREFGHEVASIVYALSTIIVVLVLLIIGLLMPTAAIYDLVQGARSDAKVENSKQRVVRRKNLSANQNWHNSSVQDLKDCASFRDMLKDIDFDEEKEQGHLLQAMMKNRTLKATQMLEMVALELSSDPRSSRKEIKEQSIMPANLNSIPISQKAKSSVISNESTYVGRISEMIRLGATPNVTRFRKDQKKGIGKVRSNPIYDKDRDRKTSTPLQGADTRRKRTWSTTNHESLEKIALKALPTLDIAKFTVNESRGEWCLLHNEHTFRSIYYNRITKEVRDERPKGWVRMLVHASNSFVLKQSAPS